MKRRQRIVSKIMTDLYPYHSVNEKDLSPVEVEAIRQAYKEHGGFNRTFQNDNSIEYSLSSEGRSRVLEREQKKKLKMQRLWSYVKKLIAEACRLIAKTWLPSVLGFVIGCQSTTSQPSEDEEINYSEQIDELETDLYYTITSVAKIDSLLFIGDVEQAKSISGQIAATNVDRFKEEEKSVMIDTWTDNAWIPDSVLYQLYIDIGTMSKEFYLNSARNSHDNLPRQEVYIKRKKIR